MAECDQHNHGHTTNSQRLLWALAVIVLFMVVEVVGGVISGSLALLADATHMLTDAMALGLAAGAQVFSARPADSKLHFGYRRTQVLAAFVNGIFMAVLLLWIVFEAFERVRDPIDINASLMFWVAVAGLAANVAAFFILHRRNERDVNMRGAMLHVMGDILGSVAAIIAAIVISLTGWMQIDPLLSVVVAVLIGVSAFRLIRETGFILLEGAPSEIDTTELATGLIKHSPLIKDIHHIQIWQLTPQHPRLTMHVCVDNAGDSAEALEAAKQFLDQNYNIRHSTIQMEIGADCPDRNLGDEITDAATNSNPVQSTQAVSGASVISALATQK